MRGIALLVITTRSAMLTILIVLLSQVESTVQQHEVESTASMTATSRTRILSTIDVNKWHNCDPINKETATRVTNISKKKCRNRCVNSATCKAFQYKQIQKRNRKLCFLMDNTAIAVPVVQRKNKIWCGIKTAPPSPSTLVPSVGPSVAPNSAPVTSVPTSLSVTNAPAPAPVTKAPSKSPVTNAPTPAPVTTCNSSGDGLLIPLYTYPGTTNGVCTQDDYVKVAEAAALGTKIIAIVNPNNGPNYSDAGAKSNYDICIAYLEANNVEVIGYVHTKLGWPDPISAYREMADIKTDINKWKNEFTVDGIFIDEMTNRWPLGDWDTDDIAIDKYQEIVNYVLTNSTYDRAVLNPGGPYNETVVQPFLGNNKVITVVYESPLSKYLPSGDDTCLDLLWTEESSSFDPGVWCSFVPVWDGIESLKTLMTAGTIPREQSAIMVYGMDSTGVDDNAGAVTVGQVIDLGREANTGWYYIQDNPDSNPWSITPSEHIMNAQATKVRCT